MARISKAEMAEKTLEKARLINSLQEELIIRQARKNVWSACLYLYPEFFKARPILRQVAEAYQAILDKKKHTLRVSVPPRLGKTFLSDIFTILYIGNNPNNCIMKITGSEELAIISSKFVRNSIKSNPKVQKLFPNLMVDDKDSSATTWRIKGSERPTYTTGGILSGNVGKGANVLITDDIFKNFTEVNSEVVRKKILQERFNTLDDRTESDADGNLPQIIDNGTSWGAGDHFNILSKQNYYDQEMLIPALVNDKSVCEHWRATGWLHRKKLLLDMYEWECAYMQNPITPEGLMYIVGFQTYGVVPDEVLKMGKIKCIADPANQGVDFFCAIAYWEYINGKDRRGYIKDVMYTQDDMQITKKTFAQFLADNEVTECKIEINKESLFPGEVEESLLEAGYNKMLIIPHYETGNKIERIRAYTNVVQNNLYFPENWRVRWGEFSDGVIRFPRLPGKKTPDDHVDCLSNVGKEVVGSLKKVIIC